MPSNYKSPFATAFKGAVKRGTPYNTVVENIAKRNNKTTQAVWTSLHKAGIANRQKFNGQWIYFPAEMKKTTATNARTVQYDCWEAFCEWALCSGFCTPEQLKNAAGSQKDFMTWCRKFWNRQFQTATSSSTRKSSSRKTAKRPSTRARRSTARKASTRKSTTTRAKRKSTTTKAKRTTGRKTTARKTTARKSSTTRNYKFPGRRSTASKSRRVRRAA